MKKRYSLLFLLFSLSVSASNNRSLLCRDAEFGAGHFKLVIQDLRGFFTPRELKPVVSAEFWIKGEKHLGFIEAAAFMPDWGADSGWYRSTPSPLDYSLCHWKKCPIRKVKLMVHTKDQHTAEGSVKFLMQDSEKERIRFDKKLHCEIK